MSAPAIVSFMLPFLGLVNGAFMVFSPGKASKKIYKLPEKEMKPYVTELVQLNGVSALSIAVAEILLLFTNTNYSKVVAIATLPRIFFMIYNMAQKTKTKLGSEFLEPKNFLKIVIATALVEGRWMNPELSLKVRGGFYLLLGILFLVAPDFVASRSNEFDANPTTARCLRAKGKSDIVFGALVYCLATMTYTKALGTTCLAWFASSFYGDFLIKTRDRFRSDAFAQLAIASVSAAVLLTA